MSNQKLKHDLGKLRTTLLPWEALQPILEVLEHGTEKYETHSWELTDPQRYVEALGRHAIDFMSRQRLEGILCTDPESSMPTLAHIVCNALFLLAHPELSYKNLYVDISAFLPEYETRH